MKTCKLQKGVVTWKNTRLCMASIPHPSQRRRSCEGKPFTDPCKFWDDGRHHHVTGLHGRNWVRKRSRGCTTTLLCARIGRSRVVTVSWLSAVDGCKANVYTLSSPYFRVAVPPSIRHGHGPLICCGCLQCREPVPISEVC
jgi:hypothetical protein